MFSFYLSKDANEDGFVTFGGYDIAKFALSGAKEADIFWAKIVPQEKFWTLYMKDVGV